MIPTKKCSLLGFQESRVKKCYGAIKQIRVTCNLHNFSSKLIDAFQVQVAFLLQIAFELGEVKTHESQLTDTRLARRLNLRLGQKGKLVSFRSVEAGVVPLPAYFWLAAHGHRGGLFFLPPWGGEGPHDQFRPVSWAGKSCVSLDLNIELLRDSSELLVLVGPLQFSRK